jgi:hypothetical protein
MSSLKQESGEGIDGLIAAAVPFSSLSFHATLIPIEEIRVVVFIEL